MALTAKQQHFCRCIVEGKTGIEAYKTAYNTQGKPSTMNTEATKLLLREDIQEYIKTLYKPIEDAVKVSCLSARDSQIEFIKERIQICADKGDEQSLIRWNDQLNRILGVYREEAQNDENTSKMADLDDSVLKKLSGIA